MDALPIVAFWALALYGLLGKPTVLLYLFFGSMPFGAFAVVPPQLTSGLTLTPTPMVVVLIILRTLGSLVGMRFFLQSALSPRRALLLFLFWIVAVLTTLFMPLLFYGEINVIPIRRLLPTFGIPLEPGAQNFSQLAYLSLSILAVFAFTRMLLKPAGLQAALKAMCLGAALAVISGLLDYASLYVPITPLLEPFRTASYSLMTEVEIFGGKRVVGLMPEASAYGSLCIAFLGLMYFLRHAMADRFLREKAAPTLVGLLLLLIWLSTSSSALVGLGVFGLVAVAEWAWRKSHSRILGNRGLGFEFWSALAALFLLGLVVLFNPALLDPVTLKINEMVLNKTQSESYEERSMWTAVGWKALADTYGLGVGVGSTRTSNFAAAVFSNTGVIGGVLFFSFVAQVLLRRLPSSADNLSRSILVGVRCCFLPAFIVALLAGISSDFGSTNAFLFSMALAVSIHCARTHRQLVAEHLEHLSQARTQPLSAAP